MYAPGVPEAEKQPGHRKVLPPGSEETRDEPAWPRLHPDDPLSGGDEQVPAERSRAAALPAAWVLALVALTAGLVALRTLDGPTWAEQSCAAAFGVLVALGLAVRSGGQARSAASLAAVVVVAAFATQWAPLLAGAAFGTAVLAACLAVLGTRPAPTARRVVLEVVLATVLAGAGGLAVEGFSVEVDPERFTYSVIVTALLATVAMVYRLGGGMHALGRRGVFLVAGAGVLLVVVLVYTAALTQYGSPELVSQVRSAQDWVREHLGGVPHPVEVLIGIPALVWGVSMRSHRRQGWWVCAFGTAATAHLASDFLSRDDTVLASGLGAVYGVVLGLLLGAALIRLERLLTGRGGGRRPETRSEPSRLHPLH